MELQLIIMLPLEPLKLINVLACTHKKENVVNKSVTQETIVHPVEPLHATISKPHYRIFNGVIVLS